MNTVALFPYTLLSRVAVTTRSGADFRGVSEESLMNM